MEWLPGSAPATVPAGYPVPLGIQVRVTLETMEDLRRRNLLANPYFAESTANRTAAEQWALCAQADGPGFCPDAELQDCCFLQVGVQVCVDTLGVSCDPRLEQDGFTILGTQPLRGFAGPDGRASFTFNISLFWAQTHTSVANVILGGVQSAIGRRFKVEWKTGLCQEGKVPNIYGGCEHCPPGWHPGYVGLSLNQASMMISAPNPNNPYCRPCPAGDYSANGTECTSCEPGRYQPRWGRSECLPCPAGTASSLYMARECRACQAGLWQDQVGTTECKTCPHGAVCLEGNDLVGCTEAVPRPGYYRVAQDQFKKCLVEEACLGGARGCAEGMEGLLCNACKTGFTRVRDSAACVECPGLAKNLLVAFAVVLALMMYIALVVRLKTMAGMMRGEVKSIIVKIVFNYFFFASVAMRYLDAGITAYASTALETLGIMTYDPTALMSLRCLIARNGKNFELWTVLLAMGLIPLGYLVAWLLMICLYTVFRWKRKEGLKGWLVVMTPIFLVIAFVLHPAVTKVFVRYSMNCLYVGGWRLEANLEIPCYGGQHIVLAVVSFVGILIWSLGVPLAFFFILTKNRKRLMRPKVRQMFGFLYNGYEHRHYYFESVFMLRKVLVIVSDANSSEQRRDALLRLLVIAILSLVLQFKASPFDNRSWRLLDHLESANVSAFLVTIVVALFLEFKPKPVFQLLGESLVIYCHAAYLGLLLMGFLRTSLVSALKRYQRFIPRRVLQCIYKHLYIAVGEVRLNRDGSLDIMDLNLDERRYLSKMLGEALAELASHKSITTLNTVRLKHMLVVAAGEIVKMKAQNVTEELGASEAPICNSSESNAFSPTHQLSVIQRAFRRALSKPIEAIMSKRDCAMIKPNKSARLTELAEEAASYCEAHTDLAFSLEELQEALMDVLDSIYSGEVMVDEYTSFMTGTSSIVASHDSSDYGKTIQDGGSALQEVIVEEDLSSMRSMRSPAAARGKISNYFIADGTPSRASSRQDFPDSTQEEPSEPPGSPPEARGSNGPTLEGIIGRKDAPKESPREARISAKLTVEGLTQHSANLRKQLEITNRELAELLVSSSPRATGSGWSLSPIDDVLHMIELNSRSLSPLNRLLWNKVEDKDAEGTEEQVEVPEMPHDSLRPAEVMDLSPQKGVSSLENVDCSENVVRSEKAILSEKVICFEDEVCSD